jgi:DNA-binding MarR family transcriptional regulator
MEQSQEQRGRKNAIGYEIKTLSNLIRRRIDSASIFSEEVTGMQGWIIGYLYHNQQKRDVFQKDIEAEFLIRRSTATGILQLMEKNDMIIRMPVEYDARLKKIVLTRKAIAVHEAIVRELEHLEEQLAQGLTKEEIEAFFTIIRKMKKNVE